MQGDPRIIDLLNQVLRKVLTGINQYFIQSRMCQNWGYGVLREGPLPGGASTKMKHAGLVIRRILFLDGRARTWRTTMLPASPSEPHAPEAAGRATRALETRGPRRRRAPRIALCVWRRPTTDSRKLPRADRRR